MLPNPGLFEVRPQFAAYQRRFYYIIAGLAGLVFLFLIYLAWGVPTLVSRLENPRTNLATIILSADGKELGSFYEGENRTNVSLDNVPANLVHALISTEDIRFYAHSGIDFKAIVNAVLSVLTSVFTGEVRGGSSITQQLARNLYDKDVGKKRTVLRKFKEAIAAVYLERKFTKGEIIQYYLNTVPFGGTLFGIQSASRHYFNKDCKDLKIEECALLVGLLRAPTFYNPNLYPKRAIQVRNTVLRQLLKYGHITKREADSLLKTQIVVQPITKVQKHTQGIATYFREHLRQWLKKEIEDKRIFITKNGKRVHPDIYNDGLKIYTTIDTRVQKAAEAGMREHLKGHQEVFNRHIKGREPWLREVNILNDAMKRTPRYKSYEALKMSPAEIKKEFNTKIPMRIFSWNDKGYIDTTLSPWDSLKYYARFLESGMVVVKPDDGHVKAWVGGIDNEFFQYDHAEKGKRQVGSTFKPFVYAAAFDNNYSPCKRESNEPVTIITDDGQEWTPKNSEEKYGGKYTLKQAIMYSVNVIAARVIDQVTPQQVARYAKQMGIQTYLPAFHSIALGTLDLSVLELTSAYATIANKGTWKEPLIVTRIEDRNGKLLYRYVGDTRQSIKHETAYLLADCMRGVVTGGTAANLHWQYKVPSEAFIAGKTGTTNNYTDGWFAGFCPFYAAAVWVGHSDQRVHFMNSYEGQGGRMAMPIFAHFMRNVYNDPELALDRTRTYPPPPQFTVETNCARYQEMHPDEDENAVETPRARARTDEFYDD
jgi:penicillin-binding protein 1A